MADKSFFNKVLQQLSDVYCTLEELKHKEQGVCDDTRILLRPWPQKKDDRAKSSETSFSNPKVKEVQKPAEILMVDKVLAKAEKARTKFKGKLPETDKNEQENGAQVDHIDLPVDEMATSVLYSQLDDCCAVNLHDGSPIKDSPNVVMTSDQNGFKQPTLEDATSASSFHPSQPVFSNVVSVPPKASVIPQSKLNKLLSDKFRADSKSKSVVSTTSKSTSKSHTGSSGLTQRKQMPVHMSAPFRTDVTVKKAKPGQTKTQMLRANANVSKLQGQSISKSSTAGQKMGQGLRSERPGSAKSDPRPLGSARQKDKAVRSANQSSINSNVSVTSHIPANLPSARSNMVEVSHGQQIKVHLDHMREASINHKLQKLSLSGAVKHENLNNNANNTEGNSEGTHSDKKEEVQFLLKTNGNQLSIPTKLSRAITNNRKLREKLKFAGIAKKAQADVSAADQFMQRMDQYVSSSFMKDQYKKLFEAKELCQDYEFLSSLFKEVCEMPLTKSSEWADVLKAKRHMETVLLTFADLENKFLTLCSGHSVYNIQREKPFETAEISKHHWLPKHIYTEKFHLAPKVKYQNKKDLSWYTDLLHRCQVLQWELYLMNETSNEVLPLLQQSQEQLDSEKLQLYRCAYSMLCSHGTTFPVMVRDSDDGDHSPDDNYATDKETCMS